MADWLFYFFVLSAAIGAAALIVMRNVFHASLALLATLLSVAALFVLLAAEFLAVVQLLIYAGGVIVIIIFGIMLTTRLLGKPLISASRNTWAAGMVAGALFVLLARLILSTRVQVPDHPAPEQYIHALALRIFTQYAFAFELAGLLLLVALVAASVSAFSKSAPDA
jgi:NADH-quinone oxidoreductase subunit J